MNLPRDVFDSIRSDFLASGVSIFKIKKVMRETDEKFYSPGEIDLPSWRLGRCTCCGSALELEAVCRSLLLVEHRGPRGQKAGCRLRDECKPESIEMCPAVDVHTPDKR